MSYFCIHYYLLHLIFIFYFFISLIFIPVPNISSKYCAQSNMNFSNGGWRKCLFRRAFQMQFSHWKYENVETFLEAEFTCLNYYDWHCYEIYVSANRRNAAHLVPRFLPFWNNLSRCASFCSPKNSARYELTCRWNVRLSAFLSFKKKK